MTVITLKATDLTTTPIPQGFGAWWEGTAASIPAGWEVMDGNASSNDPTYTKPNRLSTFLKVDADGSLTNGGASTHAHNVPSHNHTDTGIASGSTYAHYIDTISGAAGTVHTHTISSTTDVYAAANSEPAFLYGLPVIYCLKGRGAGINLPTTNDIHADGLPPWGVIGMWSSTAAFPTGWSECDGSTVNGVTKPNLRGKYIRGIASTGTTPGSGAAGVNTHAHDATHYHNNSSGASHLGCTPGSDSARELDHAHSCSSTSLTTDTQSNEPSYQESKAMAFHGYGSNAVSAPTGILKSSDLDPTLTVPRGIVVAFNSAPPAKYQHCDGGGWANGVPSGYGGARPNLLAKFIKHTAGGDAGGTGGSDSHVHSAMTHAHSYQAINFAMNNYDGGTDQPFAREDHTHTTGSVVLQGSLSGANIPVFYDVAFGVRD